MNEAIFELETEPKLQLLEAVRDTRTLDGRVRFTEAQRYQ